MIEVNARATRAQAQTMANLIDQFAEHAHNIPDIAFTVAMAWSALTPNYNYAELLVTSEIGKVRRVFYIRPDGIWI